MKMDQLEHNLSSNLQRLEKSERVREREREGGLCHSSDKCKCRHALTAAAKSEQRQQHGCKQYQLCISGDLQYCACITCTSIILNRRRKLTYNQGSHLLNNDGGMVPVLSLHSTGTKKKRDKDKHTYRHKTFPCKRNNKSEIRENEGRG